MIKGVVFDFDGTIVDSMMMIFNALNDALRKRSLPEIEVEHLGQMAGRPLVDIIRAKNSISESTAKEVEKEVFEQYVDFCTKSCRLLPHVQSTLKTLKSKQVKLGLLTTTPRKPLMSVAERFSLQDYFDIMLAKEDSKNKPDPEGLEMIIREFGVEKEECLFVGDSPIDILTGKAAQIKTAAVVTGIATVQQLRKTKPDYIIPSIEKILNYIN